MENPSPRTKKIITVLTFIPALFMVAGAIGKIIGFKPIVESFTALGVNQYTIVLGFFEIVLVVLFVWPPTSKLGFLLICSYFGGAMATHLSHGQSLLQPAIPLALFWIAAYWRNKSIFLSNTNTRT